MWFHFSSRAKTIGQPSVGVKLQSPRLASSQGGLSDFLTLWKDADSENPILKEAKAEYAQLK